MLLQPDSELYIVPAQGGEARRLRCNMGRMNSWHSWSPNGKWLVFSSKAYSVYTQLFLTHIDEQGQSTPPVVLENFTEKNRAANIPEFVNTKPGTIRKIREAFLDDTNYLRAGDEFRRQGEYANAIGWYRKAVETNPKNVAAHVHWGTSLLSLGKAEEAKSHFVQAIGLNPGVPEAHCGLGMILRQQNKFLEAVDAFREALRRKPDFALAHLHLGSLLLDLGRFDEAEKQLSEAVRLAPNDPYAHFNLGVAYARQQKLKEAAVHFTHAIEREPDFVPALASLALIRSASRDATLRDGPQALKLAMRACELTRHGDPEALYALASAYAESGRYSEAAATAQTALQTALAWKNTRLAETIQRLLEFCRQRAANR
jgi:tetratricopeptide (TPR) repeat protein